MCTGILARNLLLSCQNNVNNTTEQKNAWILVLQDLEILEKLRTLRIIVKQGYLCTSYKRVKNLFFNMVT